MNEPTTMLICIESFHTTALEKILHLLENDFQHRGLNIRFIEFPSAGPFGHQIRVVDTGRIAMHQLPEHMLRMVDRMDAFLNPTSGFTQTIDTLDCLILTESQYKEATEFVDTERQEWILAINNNIPNIAVVFWLVKEGEECPSLPCITPFEVITINKEDLAMTSHQLAEAINAEVKHD